MSITHPLRTRPIGITASSVVLGYLAVAGFAGTLVTPKAFLSMSPQVVRVPALTAGALLSAIAFVYGVTAMTAAIGLWQMRTWAPRAYLCWVVAACSFGVVFLAVVRLPPDTPPLLGVAFIVFMTILIFGWWSYIRRIYAHIGGY